MRDEGGEGKGEGRREKGEGRREKGKRLSAMQDSADEAAGKAGKSGRPSRWRWLLWSVGVLLSIVLGLGVLIASVRYYESTQYPYGWSHCCDKGLMLGLMQYAADHNGKYPAGEATPEASLSLLYPKYADENLLRGKSVPLETVERLLKQGKRLTPDTCGWHYVEGLTDGDEHELAILWDKAGLNHNGRYLRHGGHEVTFLDGHSEYIPEAEWAAFLKNQAELLAKRKPESPGSRAPNSSR
jgi:hypothetical protein